MYARVHIDVLRKSTILCRHNYVHIFVYTGVHNDVLRTIAHFCVANVHKIVDECYVHIDVDINVYILCTSQAAQSRCTVVRPMQNQ